MVYTIDLNGFSKKSIDQIISFFSQVILGKDWNVRLQKWETAFPKFPKSVGKERVAKLYSSGFKGEFILFLQKNL